MSSRRVSTSEISGATRPKLAPRKGPPGPSPPPSLRPGEGYLNIVEQFGESIAEVFELLAQEESLATPETILGFLGEVRSKYRSTSDLLAQWGVGEGQVNALRTRLLEG